MHHPQEEVTIGLVGKYVDLHDAYLSVAEALNAGGFAHDTKVHIRWVASDECAEQAGAHRMLHDVDAICVPGGFGVRGLDGKLGALDEPQHRARYVERGHRLAPRRPCAARARGGEALSAAR